MIELGNKVKDSITGFEGIATNANRWKAHMNEDAHLGIDDWLIIVGGYGAFEFCGTESEAEEMRRNKSRWEGAVAKKRRLTKRAADGAKRTAQKGSIGGKRSGRSPRQ